MHGNALAQLAIPWFVLATTGSATRTGLVAAAGLVPYVLGSALGGVVVDRVRYRTVSIVSDAASLVAVGLIPLLHGFGVLSFQLLVLLVVAGAVLDTPGATARAALLPDLARQAGIRLERANAMHEVVESGAGFAGPLLAGLLLGAIGASATLWVDAGTFAVSAVLVIALIPATATAARTSTSSSLGFSDEIRAGIRFVLDDPGIRGIYLPSIVLTFLISPFFGVVLPYHVMSSTGRAFDLGLLVGMFGGGAVLGALVFGTLGHCLPRRTTFITGVVAIGGGVAVVSLLPSIAVMAAALAIAGLIAGPNGPLVATVLQERTPEQLRGRVFGATTAMSFVAAPVGVLLAGVAIDSFGLQATLVAMTGIFAITVGWLFLDRGLREIDQASTLTPPLDGR
jgi:MFS family permease